MREREVWITPKISWFLCDPDHSEAAGAILRAIERARSPYIEKYGVVHSDHEHACLVTVLEPPREGGAERIVVWHGPVDGFFFKPERSDKLQRWESNRA